VEGIIGAAVGIGSMIWAIRRDTDKPDTTPTPPAADSPPAEAQK